MRIRLSHGDGMDSRIRRSLSSRPVVADLVADQGVVLPVAVRRLVAHVVAPVVADVLRRLPRLVGQTIDDTLKAALNSGLQLSTFV
jgi:hypothetical protein